MNHKKLITIVNENLKKKEQRKARCRAITTYIAARCVAEHLKEPGYIVEHTPGVGVQIWWNHVQNECYAAGGDIKIELKDGLGASASVAVNGFRTESTYSKVRTGYSLKTIKTRPLDGQAFVWELTDLLNEAALTTDVLDEHIDSIIEHVAELMERIGFDETKLIGGAK